MARIDGQPIVEVDDTAHPLVSWSAIFAGLFFVVAISSLMLLLGSALGLGVADATDGDAVGGGLGIAAVVWMLATSIIAFFLGSLLAARLNGSHDDTAGILNGIALWSVGTVLLAYLATAGAMGIVKTGSVAVGGAISATAGGVAAAGGATAASGVLEDTSVGNRIAAMVKSELAKQLSETQSRAPAPTVAPTNPEDAAADGAEASGAEIEQAIDEIDVPALQEIGIALVRGDTEGAKSILALNTNLSEQEIDSVIDGVAERADQAVENAKRELAQAADAASAYTQAVIWAAFASGALGLVVSIVGGMLGARTTKRLYLIRTV